MQKNKVQVLIIMKYVKLYHLLLANKCNKLTTS